jgi:hypothetical protein
MGDEVLIYGMLFCPGLIALASFGGSVWLFTHRDANGTRGWLATLGALLLLFVSLGIGACYAVTCSGSLA